METYQQNRDRRIREAAERVDPEELVISAAEAKRLRKQEKLRHLTLMYGDGKK